MAPLAGRVIFDSSALFSIITINFVRKLQFVGVKADAITERALHEHLRNDRSRQDNLLNLFIQVSPLTTSHAIGELQGLQTSRLRLGEIDLENFWLKTIDLLRSKALDEKLVQMLACASASGPQSTMCLLGPPDTGLLELARMEGCPLLTEDNRLYRTASEFGIECQLVNNVV